MGLLNTLHLSSQHQCLHYNLSTTLGKLVMRLKINLLLMLLSMHMVRCLWKGSTRISCLTPRTVLSWTVATITVVNGMLFILMDTLKPLLSKSGMNLNLRIALDLSRINLILVHLAVTNEPCWVLADR